MGIRELLEILPKPTVPVDPELVGGMRSVANAIEIELPDDFREFIATYGTGVIDNFLLVHNPFATIADVNLFAEQCRVSEALRYLRQRHRADFPFAVFPERGGLFLWGSTHNGDELFWVTDGPPNSWKCIALSSDGSEFFRFQGGLACFLCGVLSRRIVVPFFPAGFSSLSPRFERLPRAPGVT